MKSKVLVPVMIAALSVLNGCSLLVPFESEFMCEKTNDYGDCQNVESAYDQAQQDEGKSRVSRRRKEGDNSSNSTELTEKELERQRYQRAVYEENAKLLEMPVTPIVRSPTILRTMVTTYNTSSKTLYMPRYIFYFGDDAEFVFGDYLDESRPTRNAPSLSPLGVK